MHDVGASWLMTTLAPRPFMVGLVPASANLATFFLSLPAGALADALDRRVLLVGTQSYLVLCTAVLAALTYFHLTGPWTLLALTFMMAIGNAITWPAWQATTPELVPRKHLSEAIALGGVGFNLSRIVGPALGGLVVAKSGPGAVFFLNSISYIGVVIVLFSWKRKPPERNVPPEPIAAAMRTALRYAYYSPGLRSVLLRLTGVIFCGSAFWALLPLFARKNLGLGPTGYGGLLGWLGVGAVAAGLCVPTIRHRVKSNWIVACASAGIGSQLACLSYFRHPAIIHTVMLIGGVCWTSTMLSLNTAVLHQTPEWVRSRAAAVFLLVFTGASTLGSSVWGSFADHVGMPAAFLCAGTLLLCFVPLTRLVPYPEDDGIDLSPATSHLPQGPEESALRHEEGPVFVRVHYRVAPEHTQAFHKAMRQLRLMRGRNGARGWTLTQDTSCPEHHTESFQLKCWADYHRHHDRMTMADRKLEEKALAFHREKTMPQVDLTTES